tara:strand:- start:36 stop:419 length:384 start_codon:yes stop_codon:yes gene_type:complete
MAEELTKTSDFSILSGSLITDVDISSNADTDVTGELAGEIFVIKIDNTANSVPVYVKVVDGASASPGTTHPDWVFYAASGSVVSYAMPMGAPYSEGLSVWAVTGAESTGGASNTDPANDVILRMVAS